MRKELLFVLTFSGLSVLSTNILRQYYYVKSAKTWTDAQNYCRHTYTDLATVVNEKDNANLMSVLQDGGKYAWIGLYDDIMGWRWTQGGEKFNSDTDFSNWRSDEPDNKESKENCVKMTTRGFWRDALCWKKQHAVCFDENDPSMYVVVQDHLTWFEAKNCCRTNYTDLVRVRNMTENEHISSLLTDGSWIGLSRKSWSRWSDQNPRTFTNWQKGQPDNNGSNNMTSCAAVNTTTKTWFDVDCEEKHEFICQNVSYPPPIRKTTVKLRFQSEANLKDPIIQQQILQQLHAKLEIQRISDFKLRWISKDGQTFHKDQGKKKEEPGS